MRLETVSATEFKAKCLELFERLGQRQVDRHRMVWVGPGSLGQPSGQLEQQGGFPGTRFAEDEQAVAVESPDFVESLQQRCTCR